MNKLEIKHLAPYLPYGVRITKDDWGKIFKLDNDGTTLNCVGIDYVLNCKAKPILRPLSDLTKEIEINGEKFVPKNMLSTSLQSLNSCEDLIKHRIIMFDDSQKLFEWNFDVFGLIDKNLAIDINTLNLKNE